MRLCTVLFFPAFLFCLPTGPDVQIGRAEIEFTNGNMHVDATDQTTIHWDCFSIEEHEAVDFSLPGSDSLLINRVVGPDASQILGKMHSNGKIVLINPQGILFGQNSQINTQSLTASTLDLNRKAAEIAHFGQIKVEKELLFESNSILVRGNISSPGGSIALRAEKVDLFGELNVSHSAIAGSISIIDAEIIQVHPEACLYADGIGYGNGGQITLYGYELTQMAGRMSARGGEWGGNGGNLEISTADTLDFTGTVSTLSPFGSIGKLTIDPLNLTVTGANLNVTGATPFTPTGAGATLAAATVIAALGGTNVVITTLGTTGAAAGDITVNSAITWVAPTSLTLLAENDIFVNNDIQHSTAVTGGVFLNANRHIVISSTPVPARTAVGSQMAVTSVTAGGNLTVIGGTGNRPAQIGFFTAAGGAANGPISVDCVDLTVQGGAGAFSGAQIGHGNISANAGFVITTAATATITVNASGNILVRNTGGSNAYGIIGHGARSLEMGSSVNGNIAIACGGNLAMNATFGGAVSPLSIGHSSPIPSTDNIGGVFLGDIDIQIAGQLDMLSSNSVGGATVMIGHGGQFSGADASAITGDMRLCCGSHANLIAGINGAVRIGNFTFTTMPGTPAITGNMDISIGGNLTMQVNQSPGSSGSSVIGFANSAASAATVNCNMNVSVCGNATLSTGGSSGNIIGIGIRTPNFVPGTSVNLIIGGNCTASNMNCTLFFGNQAGDFNFGLGGTLTASMLGVSTGAFTAGATGVTRIFAGGSILMTPNGAGGATSLTIGRQTAFQSLSVDVRAGGDITWPNTFTGVLTAPISIQAGHTFAAGEIWGTNGTQPISVCSQAISPAFNVSCPFCSSLATASPAITPTCGALSVSALTPATIAFPTTSTLTLNSLCTACSGSPSSIGIGTDFTINNPTGPINIGAFNTIDINQNITSNSSIQMTSCHDLNLNPGFSITSNGPITLIADVDNSGQGNLNLLGGNITSNNNLICLAAGPGTANCSSNNCTTPQGLVLGSLASVNHVSGSIISGSGDTSVIASGNVLISGSATSISATGGNVTITAGINLTIEEDIVSTGGSIATFAGEDTTVDNALVSALGEIRMVAGNDYSLVGTAIISSLSGAVTLVADNQFPNRPLIGTGAFSMSCSSQIQSGLLQPVRIFTALKNLNNFCGSAQINGFLLSDPTFGLPSNSLYTDTAYEMWCTYFSCPFPYPFSGLGFPFTVFYKDCLQLVMLQAAIIADQLLVSLHPYDEFPGWMEKFTIDYNSDFRLEPYMIRRRQLNLVNHPKSFSALNIFLGR